MERRNGLPADRTAPGAADEPEHPLREYASACRQHARLIVLIGCGFAAAAGMWSVLQTPVYQSRATVVIESQAPGGLEKDKSYYHLDNSPEYFQTHFELLKSHQVIRRAVDQLKLSNRPEYQPQPSLLDKVLPKWVQAWWQPKKKEGPLAEEAEQERLLKAFLNNVEIMPIRGARLAHVTVSSVDPAFAALAANTLVSVYVERNQELSSIAREQAARWFTTHLEGLREKVQAAQEALYLYRAKHGLLTGEERKSLAGQTMAELNSQLVKTEMAKAAAYSRLQQVESALNTQGQPGSGGGWPELDSLTQVLNSQLIQMLRAQEIALSSQVADLSEKYGPLHPDRAQKHAELQNLRQRIKQEVQKIYDSLKHEYNMTVAQERAVQAAIARYGNDKIRLEKNEIEHGMLEREAESSLHVYNLFLKATKESDLSAGMQTNNVYLADPATPSAVPAKPKTKLNIVLALMTGLMSGVGLAIVLEARNKKLQDPGDVERYLPEVSLLGVVPLLPKASTPEKALVHPDAMSPAAESIRIIRTGLLLSRPDTLPSRVLITSPGDNEGKTTLAVNLALALARLERRRVVLVDVDFRKPNPHRIYEVGLHKTSAPGLAQLLAGQADIADVVHDSFVPNLSIVPSGDRPGNPTELLHSKYLTQLLEWALRQDCHMILDCPPTLPFADTAVLASKVDGVLMVVCAGKTTREACRLAIQRMAFAGGKMLGVVMQKARVEDSPYYTAYYQEQA
ncbi:GumC family protein [Nitrospira moscoviensis]|uniref:non-specific protein-tyrosine kinase n=1 Tax=Nitrospira moscoviensis TaxID=42253 RepID=A0A0K2GIJ9_NITMO|nr:polysaccharide biosynthesis tyrosine autokinase [Nitrospira moscoviensis]ALA60775.1 putative Tyrosine-protein kinase Etk [Nitrospira moscoviensis]